MLEENEEIENECDRGGSLGVRFVQLSTVVMSTGIVRPVRVVRHSEILQQVRGHTVLPLPFLFPFS